MRRVLMLEYFFPPLGGIASLRAWRFATHLPESGWEPWVVSPRRGDYYRDSGLAFPEERILRTRSLEASRAARPSLRWIEGEPGASASGLDPLRRFVRRWLYRPDPQVGWYPFALAAARQALRDRRVDAVFSSSYPVTAHLVARRLRRETGLPWVAEFRDLWSDWAVHGERRRRWDEGVERSILGEASAVVTVSPTYAEVLRGRGARAVEMILNGLDEDAPAAEVEAPEAAATYLGSFYPGRQDLVTALEALARLSGAEGLRPLVRFVGELHPALSRALERPGLSRLQVEVTGFVPEATARAYLRRSRVLLLAGPVSCETAALRGNVAAKAFEYLGARRPILIVGDPESDVARLLARFGHVRITAPGDVPAARRGLEALARATPPEAAALAGFGSRALTRRLGELLAAVAD